MFSIPAFIVKSSVKAESFSNQNGAHFCAILEFLPVQRHLSDNCCTCKAPKAILQSLWLLK